MKNLTELLFEHERTRGEQIALIQGARRICYAELAEHVRRRVAYYRSSGLLPGDRVLVFVPMSIELYEILLALFHMGCAAVFLDAWADRTRLNQALELAECRGCIGIPKAYLLLLVSRELRRVPVKLLHSSMARQLPEESSIPGADAREFATALITFTTGSTGTPKAARRTHEFLWAQHRVLTAELALPPDTVDLATLPIFALNSIASGLTVVIPAGLDPRRPGAADGKAVLAFACDCGVTAACGSPAFFERLIEAIEASGTPCPGWRQLFVGGAAVVPDFARRLVAAFPGCAAFAVYGSTEAEPIASLSCETLAQVTDLTAGIPAGRPVREIELALLPLDWEAREHYTGEEWAALRLAPGAVGEICVAGDHVLREYYRNPEAMRAGKIQVGEKTFHRTGDAGRLDADGNLFLYGRVKTIFRDPAGGMVFPMLEETALRQLPGVSAGTVLWIEPAGTTLFLETRLSRVEADALLRRNHRHYDALYLLPAIPRDPRHNSKIDYDRLRLLASPRKA